MLGVHGVIALVLVELVHVSVQGSAIIQGQPMEGRPA